MSESDGKRRYESLRRAAQAGQTRAEIAEAARELFVSRGWAATTVREVARAAGVSVPTVYAVYGNKTGLTLALADAADAAADPAQLLAELEGANADPAAQLAAMAGYDRRLFEHAGDIIALIREAGRVEPELTSLYRDGRGCADETRVQTFSSWPPGTLRETLDVSAAADIYAALCNVDVYTVLTVERGWPPERVENWWRGALVREILA